MKSKPLESGIALKIILFLGVFLLLSLPLGHSTGLLTISRFLRESWKDIGIVLLMLAALRGYGLLFFRLWNGKENLSTLAWGMGFVFMGFMVLGLGLNGLLYSPVIFLAWLPGIFFFLLCLKGNFHPLTSIQSGFTARIFHPQNQWIELTGWGCLCILLFLSLLQLPSGFLPPIGYDALEYHFGGPSYYVAHHGVGYLPGNAYANFPALTEMMIAGTMAIKGFIVSKLFIWLMGVLTAWTLYQMGKAYFTALAGGLAGAMFLALPMALRMNLQGNIDMATAFFCVQGLYAFLEWKTQKKFSVILLAGILTGGALSTKYIALTMGCLPLVILILFSNDAWKLKLKSTAIFLTGTGILFLPWLIKNLLLTGNPFFPLLYNLLGGTGWNLFVSGKFALAHGFLLTPPEIFSHLKELFLPFKIDGSSAPYPLVPIFLIPLIYLAGKYSSKDKYLWGMVIMGCLAWIFTNQVDRFLLPVFALLSLAVSVPLAGTWQEGITNPDKRKPIGFLTLIVLGMIILNGISQYNLESALLNQTLQVSPSKNVADYQIGLKELPGDILTQSQNQFLRQFYSLYPAALYMNQLPSRKRILFIGEARRMFLINDTEISTVFDRDFFFELAKVSHTPDEMTLYLKESHIGYIFYNPHELKRLESFYGPYYDPGQDRKITQKMVTYLEQIAHPLWSQQGMTLYQVPE